MLHIGGMPAMPTFQDRLNYINTLVDLSREQQVSALGALIVILQRVGTPVDMWFVFDCYYVTRRPKMLLLSSNTTCPATIQIFFLQDGLDGEGLEDEERCERDDSGIQLRGLMELPLNG